MSLFLSILRVRRTEQSIFSCLVLPAILVLVAAILPRASAQNNDEASDRPFAKTKILKGLEIGVASKRMAELVGQRGVDFALTPEIEKELRVAGADHDLIEAIRRAQPDTKQDQSAIQAGATRVSPKDGLTYVWIPPGKFMMGCSPGDGECRDSEKPAHSVTIARGFWMGQTPVTQAAYRRVVGTNPSFFHGDQLPVESVTPDEAESYCSAVGGRLPTEAEWEYAARAGSTFSRYADIDAIAWYYGNSGHGTHPVGQKQPNAWRLYDMLGNVSQLTQGYVERGSFWNAYPGEVRLSNRQASFVGARSSAGGFRCAGE